MSTAQTAAMTAATALTATTAITSIIVMIETKTMAAATMTNTTKLHQIHMYIHSGDAMGTNTNVL